MRRGPTGLANKSLPMISKFLGRDNTRQLAHTTSWGVSTRMIGTVIMAHGDDDGGHQQALNQEARGGDLAHGDGCGGQFRAGVQQRGQHAKGEHEQDTGKDAGLGHGLGLGDCAGGRWSESDIGVAFAGAGEPPAGIFMGQMNWRVSSLAR